MPNLKTQTQLEKKIADAQKFNDELDQLYSEASLANLLEDSSEAHRIQGQIYQKEEQLRSLLRF